MTPSDALATREGAAKRSRWHVQAGLLRLEIREFGVLTPWELRKATSSVPLSRAIGGPREIEEPTQVRNLHARKPGDPTSAPLADHQAGRSGKAEAVILR